MGQPDPTPEAERSHGLLGESELRAPQRFPRGRRSISAWEVASPTLGPL